MNHTISRPASTLLTLIALASVATACGGASTGLGDPPPKEELPAALSRSPFHVNNVVTASYKTCGGEPGCSSGVALARDSGAELTRVELS